MGPASDRPEGLFVELGRWRDKATKRGKVTPFRSDIIPGWLNAEIVAAQEAVGPDAAFSFLKQVPLSVRMRAEREIKKKIQKILESYKRRAVQAARGGEEFDYAGMADKLRAAVLPELRSLVVDNALRLSVDTGISFDPAIINQEALTWANQYAGDLVQGLSNTTRNQIREATSAFIQTPGLTIGDVSSLLEPEFGAHRADMIASTEVTRAYSMATSQTRELIAQEFPGLETTVVWNTMQDELVCFPAWTMVETDKGPRPIQRIEVGDRVLTRAGYKPVIAAGMRDYSGGMVRVEAGAHSVVATENHPFWTLEKGWLQGRYLKPDYTLQLLNNKTAKVRRSVNFSLGNAAHFPSVTDQIARLARIPLSVLMPVRAVNLQGNTGFGQEEVNRIATHCGLLDVVDAKGVQGVSDFSFEKIFSLKRPIAGEATELPIGIAGESPKTLSAISAVNEHGRASAFLRAIMPVVSFVGVIKDFAASLTRSIDSVLETALDTANGVAVGNACLDGECLTANGTDLGYHRRGAGSIIARFATITATLRDLPFVLVRLFAASRAGNHPSSFSSHCAHLLTRVTVLYHRLFTTSIWVYNLQVEGEPEFYANDILVHNCVICGPLEGAPKSEWENQFPDGPPAHPFCRCGKSIRFESGEQLTTEQIERQEVRREFLQEDDRWTDIDQQKLDALRARNQG